MIKKCLLSMALVSSVVVAKPVYFDQLYQSWSNGTIAPGSADKGKELWNYELIPGKSCSGCHGDDLGQTGSHVKTNKLIKPLSPKVNSKRLTKARKINKWLKRNCKFTYKRECTPEEKVSFIEFIRNN